jgi:hypothetical protein
MAGVTAEDEQKAAAAKLARQPAIAAMPARHRETDLRSMDHGRPRVYYSGRNCC